MGKDLYDNNATAKELFEKANEILGYRITDIMFEGTDDDLKQTKVTQPAVFLHSVISAICMGDAFQPAMTAGHSLGEFSALVAAGALSFEDGLRLVYARAMAMQKACEAAPSTMAAIIGLPDEKVEEVCAGINREGNIVVCANYNNPGQLVISGNVDAINEACRKGVQVVYPSGHRDTIETATLRAIRTGTAQASEQISLVRQKEVGSALRLTSSHMGARPTHELWQGEVFWVDWDKLSALYPALMDVPNPTPAPPELRAKYREFCEATGIGTVTGLAGANCRHTSSVYIEGVSHNPFEKYDSKENKRIYDLTQKQRAMERSIRKQKRMVMGLKAAVDSAPTDDARAIEDAEYQKAAATLAEQNKAYNEFCEKNDLRPLQDRLAIAQWNRKQAAAARGAAQRYKNSPK